jgi:hypothetical protein
MTNVKGKIIPCHSPSQNPAIEPSARGESLKEFGSAVQPAENPEDSQQLVFHRAPRLIAANNPEPRVVRRNLPRNVLPHQGFLTCRKPSYAKYAKTSRATQFIQEGTAQPPSNTDHLKTSRDKWPSAISEKIMLAMSKNVCWAIRCLRSAKCSSVANLFPVRPGVTLLFVFLSSEGFDAKALRALVADGDFRRLAADIANVVCVFGLGVGSQGNYLHALPPP